MSTKITKRAFAARIQAQGRTPCSQATRRGQSHSRGFASAVAVITSTLPVLVTELQGCQACGGGGGGGTS